LTFSRVSSGRAPQAPASSSTVIDVRAYAGTTWAPRPQLSFDIDGEHVDVAAPSDAVNTGGAVPDYLAVFKTVRLLERIGAGDHVAGNALGFRFELTDAQRKAFRDFVARLQSRDQERGK
jgi:hypothetical protein